MGCNKLNIFSTNEQEKHMHGQKENDIFKKDEMKKMDEENEQHMENPDNQENVVNESKDSILKNTDLKIVDEQKHNNVNKKINLENKGELPKPKLKHLNGATFDPYLTSDYNSKAYPNNMAGPNSLKFQKLIIYSKTKLNTNCLILLYGYTTHGLKNTDQKISMILF